MKKRLTLALASLFFLGAANAEVYPNTQVEVVKKESAHEATQADLNQYNKDSGILPRDGLFQPPMVPHSIRGMQVSKNFNRCLDCHSPANASITGATVPSQTHFVDRAGNKGETVSPRRYFCLQCHTPQTNASPITEQGYQANEGFNAEVDREKLPPMTKTPAFEAQFKQTLEDFKHASDPYLKAPH